MVVGAFADGTLTEAAQAIDMASGRRLSAVLKRGDLDAKAGSTVLPTSRASPPPASCW